MLAMYALRLRTEYRSYVKYIMLSVVVIVILYFMNLLPTAHNPFKYTGSNSGSGYACDGKGQLANKLHRVKYPLSNPLRVTSGVSYKIAIISDLDAERSQVDKYKWKSYLKYGHLVKYDNGRYAVDWEEKFQLTSKLNEKGRGFELSELCAFNGKLYTVDDRTGIIYQIVTDFDKKKKAIPWVILQDGNGMSTKGFKGEWMTVKDGALYVGGLGKEWTTKEGVFLNYDPLFVKSITAGGSVVHHNWTSIYLRVRAEAEIFFPGYMIHEAVTWSHVKKRWYFLPRRMSKLTYNDEDDETRGTNIMISCNEDFKDYSLVTVGEKIKTRGFSSFKFIPGTGDDVAVALKSEEVHGEINSFILVFHVETGKVLLSETYIESEKYEGIEFV